MTQDSWPGVTLNDDFTFTIVTTKDMVGTNRFVIKYTEYNKYEGAPDSVKAEPSKTIYVSYVDDCADLVKSGITPFEIFDMETSVLREVKETEIPWTATNLPDLEQVIEDFAEPILLRD